MKSNLLSKQFWLKKLSKITMSSNKDLILRLQEEKNMLASLLSMLKSTKRILSYKMTDSLLILCINRWKDLEKTKKNKELNSKHKSPDSRLKSSRLTKLLLNREPKSKRRTLLTGERLKLKIRDNILIKSRLTSKN
jgi:hypothetical protein